MVIKKAQEPFAWPPRCLLNFYVPEKHGLWLYDSSSYRFFELDDIADEMLGSRKSGTIYFGLSARSKKWPIWDEVHLQRIEWLIRYDLGFDDFWVTIKRASIVSNLSCTEEFLWKLYIRRKVYRKSCTPKKVQLNRVTVKVKKRTKSGSSKVIIDGRTYKL